MKKPITKKMIKKQRRLNNELDNIMDKHTVKEVIDKKYITVICSGCGSTWPVESLDVTSEGFYVCRCGELF